MPPNGHVHTDGQPEIAMHPASTTGLAEARPDSEIHVLIG